MEFHWDYTFYISTYLCLDLDFQQDRIQIIVSCEFILQVLKSKKYIGVSYYANLFLFLASNADVSH